MVDLYLALVIAGRRTCNPENLTVKQIPPPEAETPEETPPVPERGPCRSPAPGAP